MLSNPRTYQMMIRHSHTNMLTNKECFGVSSCNHKKYIGLISRFLVSTKCQSHSLATNNLSLSNSSSIVKQKIDELVVKYEEITGMDEVRIAQNRVIEAQDKFVRAQEKRREVVKELTTIQNKLKEVYAELDTTTRGEERYLGLVTKEHNLLKEERKLTAEFNLSERAERECFTFLSSSLKESHEKERAQAERTKYWSVIGSVIGTVIGVVGSSINNEFKMRQLRKLVMESVAQNQKAVEAESTVAAILTRHEHQLTQIIREVRSLSAPNDQNSTEVPFSHLLHNVDTAESSHVQLLVKEQKRELRLLGLAVIIIPIVVACLNRFI